MHNIIDFNPCPKSDKDGTYGGAAGSKDGILYNNEYWMLKYPKSTLGMSRVEELKYTNTPLSEYIGSHIYSILGFDTHKTELGIKRNKIVVGCKDFATDGKSLIEIRTIKNSMNDELEEKLNEHFSSTGDNHGVDFDEMMLHLRYNDILNNIDGLEDRFWDMIVIDTLINNNDRNNGNWGILRKSYSGIVVDKLAPIFDNGGSFNGNTPDSRMEKMLNNEKSLKDSSMNGITSFMRGDTPILMREMFSKHILQLDDAVRRNMPKIQSHYDEIKEFIQTIPTKYGIIPIMSDTRKDFYIQTMDIRKDCILEPYFEKAKEYGKMLDANPNIRRQIYIEGIDLDSFFQRE